MRRSGLDRAVIAAHEAGASVLGVCGGYQMLGERLIDPDGVEAPAGSEVPGLGLLPLETTFAAEKRTVRTSGSVARGAGPWAASTGAPIEGYEIHMGRTSALDDRSLAPLLELESGPDGALSEDGRVAGTYVHGLLHNDELRHALLAGLGRGEAPRRAFDREREFDRLAQHVRSHLDMERVRALLGLGEGG